MNLGNKILLRGLLAMLLAGASFAYAAPACPPPPAKPTSADFEKAMEDASDHGFMWRITKDGHTSYLYGTMHINKLDWLYLGPTVGKALNDADTVALEMDLADPKVKAGMKTAMADDHSAKLPPALAARIRKQAEALCLPYDRIAKLSPEMQVAVLSLMLGRRIGLDPGYAVDAFLAELAHAENKRVVSLETPAFQFKMIKMKTHAETIASVEATLDEIESGRALDMIKRLSQAWAHSDYATMGSFDKWCDCLNTRVERDEEKRMLDMRNPGMARRIDALHKSGKVVFAAVGSAHMFGPKGLPTLMRKRGYTVVRVQLHGRTVNSANAAAKKATGSGDADTDVAQHKHLPGKAAASH